MAKFDEKSRFLWDNAAENARKNVLRWRKNALGSTRARWAFQKVTVGVSLVKQSVRQNEMGLFHWHQHEVVELFTDFLPEGHILVEQGDVIFIMVADFQVQEFVQNHIIQTADGRMCQMQIKPEFPHRVATAPFVLHNFGLPAVAF